MYFCPQSCHHHLGPEGGGRFGTVSVSCESGASARRSPEDSAPFCLTSDLGEERRDRSPLSSIRRERRSAVRWTSTAGCCRSNCRPL